jgi:hypothetical protein
MIAVTGAEEDSHALNGCHDGAGSTEPQRGSGQRLDLGRGVLMRGLDGSVKLVEVPRCGLVGKGGRGLLESQQALERLLVNAWHVELELET